MKLCPKEKPEKAHEHWLKKCEGNSKNTHYINQHTDTAGNEVGSLIHDACRREGGIRQQ